MAAAWASLISNWLLHSLSCGWRTVKCVALLLCRYVRCTVSAFLFQLKRTYDPISPQAVCLFLCKSAACSFLRLLTCLQCVSDDICQDKLINKTSLSKKKTKKNIMWNSLSVIYFAQSNPTWGATTTTTGTKKTTSSQNDMKSIEIRRSKLVSQSDFIKQKYINNDVMTKCII